MLMTIGETTTRDMFMILLVLYGYVRLFRYAIGSKLWRQLVKRNFLLSGLPWIPLSKRSYLNQVGIGFFSVVYAAMSTGVLWLMTQSRVEHKSWLLLCLALVLTTWLAHLELLNVSANEHLLTRASPAMVKERSE
jgi:hypothetical protein